MATNKNKSNGNNEMHNKKPDSGNLKFLINAQYLKDFHLKIQKHLTLSDKFLMRMHLSFK